MDNYTCSLAIQLCYILTGYTNLYQFLVTKHIILKIHASLLRQWLLLSGAFIALTNKTESISQGKSSCSWCC